MPTRQPTSWPEKSSQCSMFTSHYRFHGSSCQGEMTCNCPCTFGTWIESVRKPLSSSMDWANTCLFKYLVFLLAVFVTYFWSKNPLNVFSVFWNISKIFSLWLLAAEFLFQSGVSQLDPWFPLWILCQKGSLVASHTSKLVILVAEQFHNITGDISNQMYGGIQPN